MFTLRLFLYVALVITQCDSLQVIPERVELHYVNPMFAEDVKTSVRRYSRKGGYYFNLEGTIKHTWGDNISFDIVLYEQLRNEYKRTFVEFHFDKGCAFVQSDPYLGKTLAMTFMKAGITCPCPAGHYILANMSLLVESFPYVWPFQKAKGVGTVSCNNRKEVIGNGSLYLNFIQNTNRKPKKNVSNQ